jgi:hypothetical protein
LRAQPVGIDTLFRLVKMQGAAECGKVHRYLTIPAKDKR